MTIRNFQTSKPQLGERVYIDPQACVIGDVVLGDDCSVWPMAVIRGDVNSIRIGARSNIQDNCTLHVTHKYAAHPQGFALNIGEDVTIGHQVMLHGCTIGNRCLIGIGAIILDNVIIPDEVFIGAGALVTEGKRLESGYLYVGSPAKAVRLLTTEERQHFLYSAKQYMKLKESYR